MPTATKLEYFQPNCVYVYACMFISHFSNFCSFSVLAWILDWGPWGKRPVSVVLFLNAALTLQYYVSKPIIIISRDIHILVLRKRSSLLGLKFVYVGKTNPLQTIVRAGLGDSGKALCCRIFLDWGPRRLGRGAEAEEDGNQVRSFLFFHTQSETLSNWHKCPPLSRGFFPNIVWAAPKDSLYSGWAWWKTFKSEWINAGIHLDWRLGFPSINRSSVFIFWTQLQISHASSSSSSSPSLIVLPWCSSSPARHIANPHFFT